MSLCCLQELKSTTVINGTYDENWIDQSALQEVLTSNESRKTFMTHYITDWRMTRIFLKFIPFSLREWLVIHGQRLHRFEIWVILSFMAPYITPRTFLLHSSLPYPLPSPPVPSLTPIPFSYPYPFPLPSPLTSFFISKTMPGYCLRLSSLNVDDNCC